MPSNIIAIGLIAVALACAVSKYFTRSSLSKIVGPKPSSFILGNLLELYQLPSGQADFAWQRLYGDVVRFKTVFGRDQLLIADPKALQRVLTSYRYDRLAQSRVVAQMLSGKGIFWAHGDDHKRHRRILSPGFGTSEVEAFLDVFEGCAASMCTKWVDMIDNSANQQVVLNISTWISLAAMDAIGQAVFDVRFSDRHSLRKVFTNMRNDIFGHPSWKQVFSQAAIMYIPTWILTWFIDHGSHSRLKRARELKRVCTEVARELVHEKSEMLLAGEGGRDIFSLLVKANKDAEARNRLSEEELLSQMRALFVAGIDTTAITVSWMLLELARHPQIQHKLRAEIRAQEAAIRARGDTKFTLADFEAMPYMIAVLKEGIRYNPAVPHVLRTALSDDVVSLSRPIKTTSGETISEIAVPKGTPIVVSICAYNRIKELWGEDAHEFNPDRWLNGTVAEKKSASVGIYSNLMTFIGGNHACLGWRFSILETQAFLVAIFGKFELTMTERSEKIVRGPPVVMVPLVDGEIECGTQAPLVVSIAACEEDG